MADAPVKLILKPFDLLAVVEGTMVEVISKRNDILQNNFNVWGAPGICIIIAVLGFNFIGDGLRDALDPKQRR